MGIRIAVLASGRGSNLLAIINAIKSNELEATVAVVLSDKVQAKALESATNEGIPAIVVDPKAFASKAEFEEQLLVHIRDAQCELICLAGFMRILSPYFVQHAPCKIMNIHPSLLPAFPGLHAHQQALDYGVKYSGCTVHFVDEGVDSGAIIYQEMVPVLPDDNEDTLSQRILVKEHQLYPRAIKMFAENRLQIQGRLVIEKGDMHNETSIN